MTNKRMLTSVLCASIVLGISSSVTGQKWLKSFDVGSLHVRGSATYETGFGANAGIRMGKTPSSLPALDASFLVPPEYTPGTPLYVGVFWHTDTANLCQMELRPGYLSVARIGSPHIVGPGATDGLAPLDGSTLLISAASNTTSLKIFTITSPVAGTNLQPFDSINFGLFRRADASSDSCSGALIVNGLAVAVLN